MTAGPLFCLLYRLNSAGLGIYDDRQNLLVVDKQPFENCPIRVRRWVGSVLDELLHITTTTTVVELDFVGSGSLWMGRG